MIEAYITLAILVALILFVWRDLKGEMDKGNITWRDTLEDVHPGSAVILVAARGTVSGGGAQGAGINRWG